MPKNSPVDEATRSNWATVSVLVTPVLRAKLNHQFMLGARNQAFVTEYVSGVETVKSLQFEPVLDRRYGDYLSSYLAASFGTRSLANTYNVVANALEQMMTLAILVVGFIYEWNKGALEWE